MELLQNLASVRLHLNCDINISLEVKERLQCPAYKPISYLSQFQNLE